MSLKIVIAGTHSGAGKTTITTGILRALYNRGLCVQPFKCGPDYIDPAFHSFVAGRTCRNLDVFMLGEDTLKDLFHKQSQMADICVIEGVMGLYDGLGSTLDNGSSAHISKLLNAPVILVIDGKGMSSSAAALVMGYQQYDKDVNIAGVIINNMHGEKHYELLKEVIERDTGIPCVGYLNKNSSISLESRHLGLIPAVEVEELDKKLDELAAMVEETIDIDRLLKLIKFSNYDTIDDRSMVKDAIKDSLDEPYTLKIAVAKDKAFNFYYEDGLDTLRELGTEIVFFSPIEDNNLPDDINGLYIGGGFPEIFAKQLQDNVNMRNSIKLAIESSLPTYAECGGLMYLSKSIETLNGDKYDMCGVFDFDTHMTKRLQRFGYVNANVKEGAFIDEALTIKAHEFHRSKVTGDENSQCSYEVSRARKGSEHLKWNCGYVYKQCLAGYAHVHFSGNKDFARNFINSCKMGSLGENYVRGQKSK